MTVKELKEQLAWYDDDMEILVSDGSQFGGSYAYDIGNIRIGKVDSYWRNDGEKQIVRLRLGGQVGAFW